MLPGPATQALTDAAEAILKGHGTLLGVERSDLADPDWFYDPVTGRRAPQDEYAFRIEHRSESVTGNVKQIWELSRLQHLTLLSAAWYATHDDVYALTVDRQLRSWWTENPFLSGVNWTSGIEIGLRLISFVWIRRLLEGWPGVSDLFENNDLALTQIAWHQQYLAKFRSRGSSANNHVIAEAAGQLVAGCAFPWYSSSERWRRESADLLERELALNTFPSGLDREQASDYHGFVTELGLVAAVEADAAGYPLKTSSWELLARMLDAEAAVLDSKLDPPRQGDSDDGRALVLDSPGFGRASILLASGSELVGPADWWPEVRRGVTSTLLGSLRQNRAPVMRGRPELRPSHFSDAGLTLLRSAPGAEPEIWCRCDGGPHGFLSIAGHAHADALSVEVRLDGLGILVDPGTYCYHGEPEFRAYFRSTIAHNTVELASKDQSVSGGPFLWLRQARTTGVEVDFGESGGVTRWSAEHDGYLALDPPALHRRSVGLHEETGSIEIQDLIETSGRHAIRSALHLGPSITCRLQAGVALLSWHTETSPQEGSAKIELDDSLSWSVHRGETNPMLGWYSSRFGSVEPTSVLLGEGHCRPGGNLLHTTITFSARPEKLFEGKGKVAK
jgi:Heparinase II/III-like protein/Heparinase II/III N-terminus